MADYVSVYKYDKWVGVSFNNEHDIPFAVGEKMNGENEMAYMNGYNWDAFFSFYLAQNAPELLEGLDRDPEAGSYAAYYKLSEENERKAQRFAEIIASLIENEDELCRIVREYGDEIEWD